MEVTTCALTQIDQTVLSHSVMPELPEVETVRRGLAPVLEGRVLTRVEARRPNLRFPFPEGFVARLEGARVETLARRAKYLVAYLSTQEALIMHLGMSGRFSIVDDQGLKTFDDYAYDTGANPIHDHVILHVEGGAKIIYNDPRRFGFMDIVASSTLEACKHFAAMGPEPLGNSFNANILRTAFDGKKSPIKAALLDQATVAGLGNIYVCEALFRAGIAPMRQAGSLKKAEIDRLTLHIRAVLSDAIEVGGSTLRDFAAADGALGGFQERFDVYGREGDACACGSEKGVITRIVQSGRSSFYCPACQR
jgi:formamidopyrimidine-DNA glycosylase